MQLSLSRNGSWVQVGDTPYCYQPSLQREFSSVDGSLIPFAEELVVKQEDGQRRILRAFLKSKLQYKLHVCLSYCDTMTLCHMTVQLLSIRICNSIEQ